MWDPEAANSGNAGEMPAIPRCTVWGQCRPVRTIQTPVYEYAALP